MNLKSLKFFFFKTLLWNLEMDNLNLYIMEFIEIVLKKEKKKEMIQHQFCYALIML